MKTTKNENTSSNRKSSTPFFNNESKGGFFSNEERVNEPFFKPKSNSESLNYNNTTNMVGGLTSSQMEDQDLGGRTDGESIGDVARPIGTRLGNVVGAIAGAFTGINISTTDNTGPTWNDHGHFDWRIGFNTTGTNGWIVQKIKNTFRAEDNLGSPLAIVPPTPEYWEAWSVDANSNVTPNLGADNDRWIRRNKGNNTQGHWSMEGNVYFTTTDPTTQGFVRGSVPDAGNLLLSTLAQPTGLGIARLHRYAQGTWDSTGLVNTHTGSAN